jgi:hypothetical protein
VIDILATASPLIAVGAIVGLYADNVAIVLAAQMILTVILTLAAGLGSQTTESSNEGQS